MRFPGFLSHWGPKSKSLDHVRVETGGIPLHPSQPEDVVAPCDSMNRQVGCWKSYEVNMGE